MSYAVKCSFTKLNGSGPRCDLSVNMFLFFGVNYPFNCKWILVPSRFRKDTAPVTFFFFFKSIKTQKKTAQKYLLMVKKKNLTKKCLQFSLRNC